MIQKEMKYISNSYKNILEEIKPKTVTLTKFMDGANLVNLTHDPNAVNVTPLENPVTMDVTNDNSLFSMLEQLKDKISF